MNKLSDNSKQLIDRQQRHLLQLHRGTSSQSLDHERLMLYRLPNIYRDFLFFVQLPPSFKMYSAHPHIPEHGGALFHLTAVNPDGRFPHQFQLIKPVDLVMLYAESNLKVLLATAIRAHQQSVIQLLIKRCGSWDILRSFLCGMNYHGCITRGSFAYQIYLCQPLKFVKLVHD